MNNSNSQQQPNAHQDPMTCLLDAGIEFSLDEAQILSDGKQLWMFSFQDAPNSFVAWGLLCGDFHTTFIPAIAGALILLVKEL